jgi:hypothetical protein
VSAKVVLDEGVTYGPGPDGRSWVKGIPQILSDPEAIQLYKCNSRFLVTELESAGKVKAAPSEAKVDEPLAEEAPSGAKEDEAPLEIKDEAEDKPAKRKYRKSTAKRKRKG